MKKRFYSPKVKKKKGKKLFFFMMFIFGIYISFKILDDSKIEINDKDLVLVLLKEGNSFSDNDHGTINKIFSSILSFYKEPTKLLATSNSDLVEEYETKKVSKEEEVIDTKPLIYIYNSHQTEEYAPSSFLEYSVNPTVMMADYIMEEIFSKNNLVSLVEERKVKDILAENGWKYSYSYEASRILMEEAKKNNPSLKYFVDVHRDSLKKDKTTVEINGKSYAKTIFLIGLENPKYEQNLDFTSKINDKLNEKYPGLSKGIYKKGGAGVNGVYNQDFSEYTILIEIGGPENTTGEVLNSTLAFAECFMEVISENEG